MSVVKVDAGDSAKTSPDAGVFTWELSTDTVYADAALAGLFGLDAREAEQGLPIIRFLDRIDPADKPKIAHAIHEAIITGEAYQQDYGLVRPDGSRADVAAFGRCFRDASGTPAYYAGIVCPRTERSSSQDALFWHCLQAHNIARECGMWDIVELLETALRKFNLQPAVAALH
jgi:PAS domain-containing protein